MSNGHRRIRVALAAALLGTGVATTVLVAATPSSAAPLLNNWSVASNPEQSSPGATLNDVSCPTVSDCVAVGATSGGDPLIEQTLGDGWHVVAGPTLPGGATGTLSGVACPTVSFCIAVGGTPSLSAGTPLVEEWDGHAWTVMAGPSANGMLASVSCATPSQCIAVGGSLTEAWSGGHGTVRMIADYDTDVSCVPNSAPAYCVAVGGFSSDLWDGTWTPLPATPYSGANYAMFRVSCLAVNNCLAVGTVEQAPSFAGDNVEQWNGGYWASVYALGPNQERLNDISCPSATSCTAVGSQAVGTGPTTSAVFEQDDALWSTWPSEAVPDPANILGTVTCSAPGSCVALGTAPSGGPLILSTTSAGAHLEVGADGAVYPFGPPGVSSDAYGSMAGQPLAAPVVGLVWDPHDNGYLEAAADGGVFSFAPPGVGADSYGSMGGHPLNSPVVGITWDPHDGGYLEVAADGGVFSFAPPGVTPDFYGSMGGHPLNSPIVGITWDPSDNGYVEVAADGGVFSFAPPGVDADFYGSMGGQHLNSPIVGIAGDPHDGGYLEVAADGGIFSFAPAGVGADFYGSMGGQVLNSPVVGITWDTRDGGYVEVAADGGVFSFAPAGVTPDFYGSMGGQPLSAPVVGILSTG